MALNDAIILETVVTPVDNGTIIRIQIADAPLRDGLWMRMWRISI